MHQVDIIKAIEAHAEDFGLQLTTIGQLATDNRHAYDRIKSGRAHRKTEDAVRAWIKTDRSEREAAKASKQAASTQGVAS